DRAKTDFPRSTVRADWHRLAGNRGFRSTAGHGRDHRAHDWHRLADFSKFGIWLCPVRSGSAIRAAAAATLPPYVSAPAVALASGRSHPAREYSEPARG